MLISTAYAAQAASAEAPGMGEAFMLNLLLILILVAIFFVLVIMPQQKRFKQHRSMLDALKKGDTVITSGGFIATVDKIKDDEEEVTLELGDGVKVKALRSTIQQKREAA